MGNIHTVGPNQAIIVSGGWWGKKSKKMIVGGWAWGWWLVSDIQRLSLECMTLIPKCERVETSQGVPVSVTGVAQCKIMTDKQFLSLAAEQFLGKSVKHIKLVILQTLEGHLRAILGTLTIEDIYRDREKFASLVREVATPDVGRMGFEILSFTIKDVYDDVTYLASLGKTRAAEVKRDADVGVALAERDAGIREAECEKQSMDVKYSADTKIENSNRSYQLQKAQFDAEVNSKKAESSLAYELQSAKVQQSIKKEIIEIDIVERRKQIDLEEKEILRKEKELTALIRLPADAQAYKLEVLAQGMKFEKVERSRAEAERVKMIGSAQAYSIEMIGKAEAEEMRQKAQAYKLYGDAAILALTLECLPKIAAEVAKPLAKTDEIVLLGGTAGLSSDLTKIVAQLPPALHAITGIDLSKVLSKIPGAL